ncbi:hypothetical protein ACIBTV_27545 [Micromonospora sp. NPDC049366]|uniref:hypothetical protein n=1 Tax=Micromonospora sp. NPDC049366 TaxID=3364271 RepID=UPI0037B45BA7
MSRPNPALPALPAAGAAALEGDVHAPAGAHYTHGTDLEYVLAAIAGVDPIDVESDDPSDTDWAVHRALNHVRADIMRRLAVQAGPRAVDYCGADGDYGHACGPDLGLPQCAYHARPADLLAERFIDDADRPELDDADNIRRSPR